MICWQLQSLRRWKFERILIERNLDQVGHFAECQRQPGDVICGDGEEFEAAHPTDGLGDGVDLILANVENLEFPQSQHLAMEYQWHSYISSAFLSDAPHLGSARACCG